MQNKISPQSAPSRSANDNGPLTSGQVKALKAAIAIMSIMIVAALLAIVARVIYLSAIKTRTAAPAAAAVAVEPPGPLAPQQSVSLPPGAVVKNISMIGNRLLVHYQTAGGSGVIIQDLSTGKALTDIKIDAAR